MVLPSTIGVIAFWSCRLVLRPGRRPSRLRPRIHLGYDPITALASYDNVLSVRPLVFKAGRFAQSLESEFVAHLPLKTPPSCDWLFNCCDAVRSTPLTHDFDCRWPSQSHSG